jgi:hypothetical protein
LKHRFQSAKSDGADSTLLQPSNWNAPHDQGVTALSANTTLDATHDYVPATAGAGGITITLPTAVGVTGRTYTIKKVDSGAGNVTVATTSSQTIDGATTYTLGNQFTGITVVSNGANWDICGRMLNGFVESFRTANATLTANTFLDNVSITLDPGVWLIAAVITVGSPSATAQRVTAKLWDGTTVFVSTEGAAPSQGTSTVGWVSLTLTDIQTIAATATVKVTVASTAASILEATPGDNATGLTNTANSIRAVRIA